MSKNNDTVKRALTGVFAVGVLGMAGWAFIEVRDLPAAYPTRIEVREHMREFKHDINERLDRIEKKLDRLVFRRDLGLEEGP